MSSETELMQTAIKNLNEKDLEKAIATSCNTREVLYKCPKCLRVIEVRAKSIIDVICYTCQIEMEIK